MEGVLIKQLGVLEKGLDLLQSQWHSNPIPRRFSNLTCLCSNRQLTLDTRSASAVHCSAILLFDNYGPVQACSAPDDVARVCWLTHL
jgi:hypothetical protein